MRRSVGTELALRPRSGVGVGGREGYGEELEICDLGGDFLFFGEFGGVIEAGQDVGA